MNIKRTVGWIFLLPLFILTPSACKKITNPLDNLKLIIDYNLIKTTVDFHIKDATTGQYLGSDVSREALIIISGKDAQGVVDPVGGKLKDNAVKVTRGLASIGISPAPAYTPSATKPVEFSIVVMAPGYLTTTRQVSLTQTGRHFIEISMVNLNNTPNGVNATQQNGAANLNNGSVTAGATVQIPVAGTNLNIPQGLIMKDANGNLLQGQINVTIVHFDPTVVSAINAFPGGMLTTVKRANGSSQKGIFYSAGFVAIDIIDQNGRVASIFENGTLTLTTDVSNQVYNPNNGGPVSDGNSVGIWSLSESNGQWQEEGSTTIFSEGGKLKVTANLSHLSYYAFNWFGGNLCEQGRPFVFNINPSLQGSFLIKALVYRQSDNALLTTSLMWITDGQPVYMTGMPQNIPIRIEWSTENSPFLLVDQASQNMLLDELCGSTPAQVNLIVNNNNQYSNISFQVSVYCADRPDLIIYPSFTAYCQLASGGPVIPIELIQGAASVSGILLGEVYYVWVIYDGNEYGVEATPTQTQYSLIDFEIPADVCNEVFGPNK